MVHGWSASDIPDLSDRFAIVTGATSGIGLETALQLARAGAEVMLTGRNDNRGEAAVGYIRTRSPKAKISYASADLSSLASIAAFAESVLRQARPLDLLVNNAGVVAPAQRQVTRDGFELQFGINYLGHFALSARLMPALLRATAPRLVGVSSTGHRSGRIDFADLQSERSYSFFKAYSQSKLAMLMFTLELHRRAIAAGLPLAAIAAHPGWASTNIASGMGPSLQGRALAALLRAVGQSSARGALPILFAATAPNAVSGAYYGPDGFKEMRGSPTTAQIAPQGQDLTTAEYLWRVSEALTKLHILPSKS